MVSKAALLKRCQTGEATAGSGAALRQTEPKGDVMNLYAAAVHLLSKMEMKKSFV